MTSHLEPEPWISDRPTTFSRWECGELVGLTAVKQFLLCRATWKEDDGPAEKGYQPSAFEGELEPSRWVPRGTRLFHSDMGTPAECWELLDTIPSIGARPGDLLFHCPQAVLGRLGSGDNPWPTIFAIMYPDESTYVAFITQEHWESLHFHADAESEVDTEWLLRRATAKAGGVDS